MRDKDNTPHKEQTSNRSEWLGWVVARSNDTAACVDAK